MRDRLMHGLGECVTFCSMLFLTFRSVLQLLIDFIETGDVVDDDDEDDDVASQAIIIHKFDVWVVVNYILNHWRIQAMEVIPPK